MNGDKRTARIQVSAEQARITEETRVRLQHEREQLRLQRERQKLILAEEKKQARDAAKQRRRIQRQQTRTKLARRIYALMPTIGRRAMIVGPILAPMAVAWIGQIGFATHTLKWPLAGGLVFAAAWELTTAFAGWMYHEARKAGDRGALFRAATWVFASSAGAMNYWHALGTDHSVWHPTPKAVSYGTMSLVGIGLWELYASLIHRKHLRADGKMPAPRPRFGILLWVRFPRITWHAWSLSVRYGIRTVDAAWVDAVAEVERIDRMKAAGKARKRLANDKRPRVAVTVVRIVDHTFPAPKTTLRLYRVHSLATTYDHASASTPRPVDASTPVAAITASTTTGRVHNEDHPDASTRDHDHHVDATTTATTPNNHHRDRTRTRPKSTTKTGRVQVDTTGKPQPTDEDKAHAIALYLQSVKDGKPLSKRALAKAMGFSASWALKCIQEAGPRPVGSGNRDRVHVDATTPKDHPETSEVKTG